MELRHITVDGTATRRRVLLSGARLGLIEARELEAVFTDFGELADLRVVVIGSAGDDFCPGLADDLDPLHGGVDPVTAIAAIPCPVVIAMRGHTGSVGLEIALAGDIRIAQTGATFALTEVGDTRLPSWGGTQRLPRIAGRSVAAMMLLAAARLDTDEAMRSGLVYQTVQSVDAAIEELAEQLAGLAPLALAAAKEALAVGPELPMQHALELEGDLNHLLQTTADRAEGLQAFFEKRTANFEGR